MILTSALIAAWASKPTQPGMSQRLLAVCFAFAPLVASAAS
jgi:hypothetical protein